MLEKEVFSCMLELFLAMLLIFVTFLVIFIAGCAISIWLLILEWVAKLGKRFADMVESHKANKGQ